ncbi:MAG TPA: universal stress protein [Gemmatimonadaceae bacterium]|nr:universal stress protein [Gemmatimonadaceae bacterium]
MTTSLHVTQPSPVSSDGRPTFARMLLGIDFGSASLAAARWAAANVAPRADAIVAHVMPCSDHDGHDGDGTAGTQTPREKPSGIAGGLGGFAATLDAASARSVLRSGSASHWLSAIANDAEASLVVLGRRSDANRTRVGEPNVIERVARRTSASVLVVPERTGESVARVVAAVDDSPFAPRVLAVAARLARMHELVLSIVHVLSPVSGTYARVARPSRNADTGDAVLPAPAPHAAPLRLPIRVGRWLVELASVHHALSRDRMEVTIGDPARELTRAAAPNDRTLVVVGMRGADGAPVGSVGSVARELLTRGTMPVLAVNGL